MQIGGGVQRFFSFFVVPLDDEYRRVWWQSATLLATNLIYTPKKIEQNKKKQHKKTAIAPVDLGRKTEIYPSCPSWLTPKKN